MIISMITDQSNPTTSHHDDLPASSDLDLCGGCDIIREGKKNNVFWGDFSQMWVVGG